MLAWQVTLLMTGTLGCLLFSAEVPLVRNVSVCGREDYALPGLAHKTVAGAVHHGMKEVSLLDFQTSSFSK